MYIDKDSLIINGVNMGTYLTQADFEYNKLWASDSGRNLAGEQMGTLIGIFPKIVCSFRKLTQEDLRILAPILDSARQEVTYFDDNLQKKVTMTTYSGDWKAVCKSIGKVEGVQCSFISTKKRGA